MLNLYTQDNCPFCGVMIQKLAEWGMAFEIINISKDAEAKAWLKSTGCKTVPQLFLDDFNVNKNIDTREFTEEMFYDRVDVFIEKTSFNDIAEMLGKHHES
jgi:glutaredoxin